MKKLSKDEMKKVMGGVYEGDKDPGAGRCLSTFHRCGQNDEGRCEENSNGKCVCNTGKQSWLSEECVK